jgi:hypothetical protein
MSHTMMRVGEVNALDCDDYDSVNQSLHIRFVSTIYV